MPALKVFDLVVGYGTVTAVAGVSFTADTGEILALLGPNGAGKTTTVETMEGYRRPTAGVVRVLDCDPITDKARLVPRIGVMLQRGGVYPAMNARQALRLFASYYEHPQEPDALVELVGLDHAAETPWRRLSGGEQQRLSLALALIGRPQVAFLDEPTAGVDPGGRLAIRRVVEQLRDDGVCVVLTTHELEEAERLADRVIIMDRGRVVADGTPAALMSAGGRRDIRFGGPPGLDVGALSAAMGAPVTEERRGEYLVGAEPTPAAVAALTAWLAERDLPLADLRAGRHTLEDVFLQLTGAPSTAAVERERSGRRRGRARRRGADPQDLAS